MPKPQPTALDTAIRSFPVRPQVRTLWTVLAVVGIAMFVAQLAANTGGGFSTLAAVGLLMAIWSRRATVVRVFDNHFELKIAPFAALRMVRYADLEQVDRVNHKKALVHYRKGDRQTKLSIPLNMLTDEHANWLVQYLQGRTPALAR